MPKDNATAEQADMEAAAGTALVKAAPTIDIDASMAAELSATEIDRQIATAHKYPRSMAKAIRAVIDLATVDTPTAMECFYSLPRDGKLITGPSIRFAELLFQLWGNNRIDTMIVAVNEKAGYIEASAAYHDLETNSASRAKVRRRIKGKNGALFSYDMIMTTGNAAISIAKRNAILAGIPKPIWRQGYEKCLNVARGDEKSLGARRAALLEAMVGLGLTLPQIFTLAGVGGEKDIGLDHLVQLSGLYTGLKNGEMTMEDLLGRAGGQAPTLQEAFGDAAKPKEGDPPADGGKVAAEPEKPAEAPQEVAKEPSGEKMAIVDEDGVIIGEGVSHDTPGVLLSKAEDLTVAVPQAFVQFSKSVDGAGSWDDVRGAMQTVRQTAPWTEAPDEARISMDAHAYARTTEMIDAGKIAMAPEDDLQFFVLWLEQGAKPEDARPALQRLIRKDFYQQLPEERRKKVVKAVMAKEGATP